MFTLQQLLAPRGQDNIKTLQALYEGSFVCAQRLISLNLKATRSIMESNVSGIKAMMAAQGVPALCATQSEMAHQLIQQAVGYAIDFNEVIAENQQGLSGVLDAGSGSPQPSGAPVVEKTPTTAAGTRVMIDVMKAMLDAATASRDTMLEMARQVDASVGECAGTK
ncbi:phasin family protein [Zoogloea sp.]|uniref:phasin family protein n=1 Tax=Zoogloea sp. TaxID=49181 RepID=UPI001AD58573|nr:phasin family protein [Zoogloea sp.]MBN8283195.1 phasin family protein [Zoogloea sp.]